MNRRLFRASLLSKRLADLTSGAPASFGHNGISIDITLGQHTLTLGSMYLPDQGKHMPAYNATIENLERMMEVGGVCDIPHRLFSRTPLLGHLDRALIGLSSAVMCRGMTVVAGGVPSR